jgi:hypothetical protein
MKSILLTDESPLYVLPSLAERIGLTKSIILQHIHFLINERRDKIIADIQTRAPIESRNWIHNTYLNWQEQFPFLSKITIRKSIKELEEMGILLTYFYSRKRKCYTIDYEAFNTFLQKEWDKEND